MVSPENKVTHQISPEWAKLETGQIGSDPNQTLLVHEVPPIENASWEHGPLKTSLPKSLPFDVAKSN
jgi:hypothetical protein